MKRGALARDMIASMIMVLAIMIIIFFFISRWQDSAEATSRAKACKTSVYANAGLHLKGIEFSGRMNEVNCPTEEIIIKKGTSDEKAKETIAKAMATCWDNYGEGRLNLFSGDNLYCGFCSIIRFEESGQEIEGFPLYLQTRKMPYKGISYMSYFMGYETDMAREVLEKVPEHNQFKTSIIGTGEEYTTVFLYAKGYDAILDLEERLQSTSAQISVGAGITSAGVVVAIFLFGSNPIGWVAAIGTGIVAIGAAIYNYIFDDGVPDQWVSLVLFRQVDMGELSELGCNYLPAKQT